MKRRTLGLALAGTVVAALAIGAAAVAGLQPANLDYGSTVAEIDERVGEILLAAEPGELGRLLDRLTDRFGLVDEAALQRLLSAFGATRVIHGHTPIAAIVDVPPVTVREPLVTSAGRLVNVDHCLFGGGPGFVTRLDEL